ncbi:devC protein [Rubidibacter lacunae KORDI 51-2]|uniref:DevC protein n=1 Tax=Rubidibacter lacunae KORDI 51-2 TaxID=582515 RepID=U5DHG8_9CHRO|nr:ABC transporter permease DevC [Rubidibacter lacunae]ERN40024.1 devC protein [Rubidibacter lacunae KORDI 51-2]
MKYPLGWLQLSHRKLRLAIALAGIGFADVLMFMQLGFQSALFKSSVILHERIDGDIFLVSPQSSALIALATFSRRRVYQALAVEGVASAHSIYIGFGLWKNPVDRSTRSLMVLGVNPVANVLDFPGIEENLARTTIEDVVLFDEDSRAEFGPIPELYDSGELVITEVGQRRVIVGGLFALGASFSADGNLITSDLNFLRIFPERNPSEIEIGVLQLEPSVDPDLVQQRLRQELPEDVIVFTREEFINAELSYWQEATAIGFVFTLGLIIGLIVGIVIVYQILYTDVSEHLPEYATLKAMGYRDRFLLQVVLQEALILAILGYLPALAIASGMYALARAATGLPMLMTLTRAGSVFVLTAFMCFSSGALAVRKLQAADPADIF